MLIIPSNMNDLFRTFTTAFNKAQQAAAGRVGKFGATVEDLAFIMSVTGASTTHAWMEQIRGMREWIGPRAVGNIKAGGLTVVNRNFEATVGVPVPAIDDDQYGVYAPIIAQLGSAGEQLWKQLLIEAMLGNANWADGNPFFCSGRTLSEDSGALTNAVTTALSATALETALAAMLGWKLFGGEPADVTPTTLLVGPAKESVARGILLAELVNDGSNVQVSNTLKDRLELRVDNRITGNQWFVLAEKNGLKAFVVQKRKTAVLTRRDNATDSCVFTNNEAQYGADARGEAFGALPFLAYAGGLDAVSAFDATKVPA